MRKIAIIPARGGSKRILRKNIKSFLGKPIIAYSIDAAIESRLFDEIMVSTDDAEIAEIAKKYGAKVPFLRSSKNADDYASTIDVINEVINEYQLLGENFDVFCCIYPTAPFVTEDIILKAYNVLKENNYVTVFPIVKFGFPIQRAIKVNNGLVQMFQPEHQQTRSQDLENSYHDAGQFYWGKVKAVQATNSLWTENSGYVEVSELAAQDIDNEVDWKLAELKLKLINAK